MSTSIHQQESNIQPPSSFLARLSAIERILRRLAGLVQLTEEELKDAGIYLGVQHYE